MTSARLVRNNLVDDDQPYIVEATGSWLVGERGERYLDAASGAVVTSIGHSHPKVVQALAEQASRVTFTHRGAFNCRDLDDLAERLCDFTGYDGAWFVNSGSEAVEAALQFALQFHSENGESKRTWFLSPELGYNGNTLGGLSLSGHVRRRVVGPLAYGFNALPATYALRDAPGVPESDYAELLLVRARKMFETHAGHLAGIVLEPVGGATAGCTLLPDGYLLGLRRLCDEFGALLIVDEVMSGLMRAGAPMAAEQQGVTPDIAAVGKGLGAGYVPVAAVLIRQRILNTLRTGTGRILGGHTYAGNPLAAAVGLAVLSVLEDDALARRAQEASDRLEKLLRTVAQKHRIVAEVRGRGMMWAIELRVPDVPHEGVTTELSQNFFRAALREGIVVYPATGGINDAVLVCPPLTVTDEELVLLEDGLDRALRAVIRADAAAVV